MNDNAETLETILEGKKSDDEVRETLLKRGRREKVKREREESRDQEEKSKKKESIKNKLV